MTTKVTIEYANGDTRLFQASDDLEKLINEGRFFSVSTMHSDINISEEKSLSKMYAGNPVAALGDMINLRKILTDKGTINDGVSYVLNVCVAMLSDEITSHQSGMVETFRPHDVEGDGS
tara:strand:+ start:750 stop:1106 length:357 start_codon:yes stop_codon:yes gene_type:complete